MSLLGVPIGFIGDWWATGPADQPGDGWVICDGTTLTNAPGNIVQEINPGSAATFVVPDLRNAFILGADVTKSSSNTGDYTKTDYTGAPGRGAVGGANPRTLISGQVPAHTHTATIASGGTISQAFTSGNSTHTHNASISSVGDHTHQTGVTFPTHTHTITLGSSGTHTHSGNTAGHSASHTHTISLPSPQAFFNGPDAVTDYVKLWVNGDGSGNKLGIINPTVAHTQDTGSESNDHTHSFSASGGGHSHSGTTDTNTGAIATYTSSLGGGHSHSITLDGGGAGGSHSHSVPINISGHSHGITIDATGGPGNAFDNRPRFVGLVKIIKVLH